MNDTKIIEFLNGRTFAWLACAQLLVTALFVAWSGLLPSPESSGGLLFNIDDTLAANSWLSVAAGVAGSMAAAWLMLLLNKWFTFVKSLTFVGAAAFFLLQLATPLITSTFNTGTVMLLLLVVGALVLFGCYQDKHAQKPIFLVMCILAFGVMVRWAVVVLIPAFLLGFAYMRAMNWRGVMSALIGLVTPFWIVLGLGLAAPADFKLPELNPFWNTLDLSQVRLLVAWVAFIVVLTIVLSVVNLFTIYSYRLQLRVYNAFFLMVTLFAVAALCIDHRNLTAYLPVVNLCLSVQIAHAFTISKFPKQHIFIIALVLACFSASLASMAM